jgi:hypothetical protein
MTKIRLIFYSVFGAFHLVSFIFTLFLHKFILDLVNYLSLFKYIALFGLLLLITDVIWSFKVNRDVQKQKDALTHELNMLKARLYDLQEGKETPAPKTIPPKA